MTNNKFLELIFGIKLSEKKIKLAFFLGFSGAIPFIYFSTIIFYNLNFYLDPISLLRRYSEIILSFLGAVHWGVFFSENNKNFNRLVWSVTPSMIAFFSTFFSNIFGIYILIAGFFLSFIVDRKYFCIAGYEWYLSLRLRLTIIVTFSLLLTLEKLIRFNS